LKNFSQHAAWTFVLSVLVVCTVLAGGYQIGEQGARAVGMGGAFVANASDPSAIYYNPAGLVGQTGINVLGGFDLIMPSTKFAATAPLPSSYSMSTNSQVFTPINVYGTYQVDDDMVVGLGIFNPFGLGTDWPAPLSTNTSISTFYFNPSIGYKINEDLSVGLGISFVYGSVSITAPGETFDATGSGFNINIGAKYKVMPGLTVGLSYRIETDVKLSGDLTMSTALGSKKGTGDVTVPMPGNLQIGAAYDVMPELTVEADLQYVQWGAFESLDLNYNLGSPIPAGTQAQPQMWDDGITVRVGGEYKYSPEITLRAGLIIDLTPQGISKTTPMLPDADRTDISLGGSYKIDDNWHVDASYMLVLFADKTVGSTNIYLTPGTYSSTAHVFSVNVGYAF